MTTRRHFSGRKAGTRNEWMSSADFDTFSFWVSCGSQSSCVCLEACRPHLHGGFSHTLNTNTHMHKHMKNCVMFCNCTHARSLSFSLSPLLPFVSLSNVFRLFFLSSLSPSTSSCVRQLRNISRRRLAINIVCPPRIVRVII